MGALAAGHSAQSILRYVSQHSPQLAAKISAAINAGHTIDHIMRYLSKNNKSIGKLNDQSSQVPSNLFKTAQSSIHPSLKGTAKLGLGAAAGIGGAFALSRAIPQIVQNLSPQGIKPTPTLPNPAYPATPTSPIVPNAGMGNQTPNQPTANTTQQPPSRLMGNVGLPRPFVQPPNTITNPNSPNFIDQQSNPTSNTPTNISQPTQIKPPEVNPIDAEKVLKDRGVLDQVKTMLKAGNKPEEITALIAAKGGKGGKFKAGEDPELLKAIEQYAQTTPQQPQINAPVEPESPKLDERKQEVERQPIAKNQIVSTPQGVGEVKEIRNGQAVVEVDGKRHKVSESEIEPPAFTDDEVADAYDNLMAKIPEEHRSGFLTWSGYDEDLNKIVYIPIGGKAEELYDITPEEVKKIKEGKGVARTTGENREGFWVEGGDTRGGVISQIVHDRRRAREAGEKKQLKFDFGLDKPEKQDKGVKPIYDAFAYPRNLSHEREKKKKLEERAKLKAEKERLKHEERARKKRKK